MSKTLMHPVIKWAGGKTQLLYRLLEKVPQEYNTYYEPFIGGGAMLLGLHPRNAVINDVNQQLINMYEQLKKGPEQLYNMVVALDSDKCDKTNVSHCHRMICQ